jgi:hypothetical protein
MIINAEPTNPDLNSVDLEMDISDFSAITDLFLCLPAFHFNSTADFADRDKWNEGIFSGDIIPIHDIYESVDQSEPISLTESKHNFRYAIKPGKYRFQLSLCIGIATYNKLCGYAYQNLKCYAADINGNMFGVSSGSEILPFNIDPLIIDKINWGLPNTPSWTNILIGFTDPSQFRSAYVSKQLWEPSDLWNAECTISLTGGWSTINETDFSNWAAGIPTGFFVDLGDGSSIQNDSSKLKAYTDYSYYPNDTILMWHVSPAVITAGNYRFTIDVVSVSDSDGASLNVVINSDVYPIPLTLGTHSVVFTVSSLSIAYLFIKCGNPDVQNMVLDNWLLEQQAASIVFTAIRSDGDPISNLTISDISISDDINGDVALSSVNETSPGTYTIVPTETLSSGTVTLLSENYHGTYDYDL